MEDNVSMNREWEDDFGMIQALHLLCIFFFLLLLLPLHLSSSCSRFWRLGTLQEPNQRLYTHVRGGKSEGETETETDTQRDKERQRD